MPLTGSSTLREAVARVPNALRILTGLDIDISEDRTLGAACEAAEVSLEDLLTVLEGSGPARPLDPLVQHSMSALVHAQSGPLPPYSAGAFLGRSVNALIRQRGLRATTVYETAMADSLKSMALQGLGVAWVPRLSVTAELARGELVICGDEQWQVPLEIRLYRSALQRKAAVRLLWRKLEAGAGM